MAVEAQAVESEVVEEVSEEMRKIDNDWADMVKRDRVTLDGEVINEDDESDDDEAKGKEAAIVAMSHAQKVTEASSFIEGALRALFGMLFRLDIPDAEYQKAAKPFAEALCHYYKGGLVEFLIRHNKAMLAFWAAIGLGGAVRVAIADKRRELAEKQRLDDTDKGSSDG